MKSWSSKKRLIWMAALLVATVALLGFIIFLPIAESSLASRSKPEKPSKPTLAHSRAPSANLAPEVSTIQETGEQDPISSVLSNESLDFAGVVKQFLSMLPSLNSDQQREAAQHMANLSDDALSNTWSQMIITNSLPQDAAEVLFNDMLNRPHEQLMPFLGAIADQPAHPLKKDSVDVLEILYGQPPAGATWSAWIQSNMAKENSGKE